MGANLPEEGGVIVLVGPAGEWNLPEALVEAGVRRVLEREGAREGEISVTFLDDEGIRALNREYLGEDRPTDVIAFALHDPGAPPLGDVYVGYDQARRQAEELGVELAEELLRLAIHGTLHVMGHEHPEEGERAVSGMYRLQEAILREVLEGPLPPG